MAQTPVPKQSRSQQIDWNQLHGTFRSTPPATAGGISDAATAPIHSSQATGAEGKRVHYADELDADDEPTDILDKDASSPSDMSAFREGEVVVDAHSCQLKTLSRLPLGLNTEILFVHKNMLEDLGDLAFCQNLRKLDLAFCQLKDLQPPRAPNTTAVSSWLGEAKNQGQVQISWGNLSQLEVLYLHGNKFCSTECLFGINQLPNLQVLTVYKNPFREALRTPMKNKRRWYAAADDEELQEVFATTSKNAQLRSSVLKLAPPTLLSLDGELVDWSTMEGMIQAPSAVKDSTASKIKLPAPQFHAGATPSQHLYALSAEISVIRQKYTEIFRKTPSSVAGRRSSHSRSRSSRRHASGIDARSNSKGPYTGEETRTCTPSTVLSREEMGRRVSILQTMYKQKQYRKNIMKELSDYVTHSLTGLSSLPLEERRRIRSAKTIQRCVRRYLNHTKKHKAALVIQKVWRGYWSKLQTLETYIRTRQTAPAYNTYKFNTSGILRQMAKLCSVTYTTETTEEGGIEALTKQPSTVARTIYFRQKHRPIVEAAVQMAKSIRLQWLAAIDSEESSSACPGNMTDNASEDGYSDASSEDDEEQKKAKVLYTEVVAKETAISPEICSTYALDFDGNVDSMKKDEPHFRTSHIHMLGSWPGGTPSETYRTFGLSSPALDPLLYSHPVRPFFQNVRWFTENQLFQFAPSLNRGKKVQLHERNSYRGVAPENSSFSYGSKTITSEPEKIFYPRPISCYVNLIGGWDHGQKNPFVSFVCRKKAKKRQGRRRRSSVSSVRRYSVTYFMTETDTYVDSFALAALPNVPSFVQYYKVTENDARALKVLPPRRRPIHVDESNRIRQMLQAESSKSEDVTVGESLIAMTAPSSRFLARMLLRIPYALSKHAVGDYLDEPIVLPADVVEAAAAATKVQAFWRSMYYKHSLKPQLPTQIRERRAVKCLMQYHRSRMLKRRLSMISAVSQHVKKIGSPVLFLEQSTLLILAGAAVGFRGYGDSIWRQWMLTHLDDEVVDKYPGVWSLRHISFKSLTIQEQLLLVGAILEGGKATWKQYPVPEHEFCCHFENMSDTNDEIPEDRERDVKPVSCFIVNPRGHAASWNSRRVGPSEWFAGDLSRWWKDEKELVDWTAEKQSRLSDQSDEKTQYDDADSQSPNPDMNGSPYGHMFDDMVDPFAALVPIIGIGTKTQSLSSIVFKPKFTDQVYDSVYEHIRRGELDKAWKTFPNWASVGYKLYAIKFSSVEEARKRAAILMMQTWDSRIGSGATLLTETMLDQAWQQQPDQEGLSVSLPTPWVRHNIRRSSRLYDSMEAIQDFLSKRTYRRSGRWKLHKRQTYGDVLRNVQALTLSYAPKSPPKKKVERTVTTQDLEESKESKIHSVEFDHESSFTSAQPKEVRGYVPMARIELKPLGTPLEKPGGKPRMAGYSNKLAKMHSYEQSLHVENVESNVPENYQSIPSTQFESYDISNEDAAEPGGKRKSNQARCRVTSVRGWEPQVPAPDTPSLGPFSRGSGVSGSYGMVSKALQQRIDAQKDKIETNNRRRSQETLEASNIKQYQQTKKRYSQVKQLNKQEDAVIQKFVKGCSAVTRHQSNALAKQVKQDANEERIAHARYNTLRLSKNAWTPGSTPGTLSTTRTTLQTGDGKLNRDSKSSGQLATSDSMGMGALTPSGAKKRSRSRGPPLRKM